jgi:hypothetical protein
MQQHGIPEGVSEMVVDHLNLPMSRIMTAYGYVPAQAAVPLLDEMVLVGIRSAHPKRKMHKRLLYT